MRKRNFAIKSGRRQLHLQNRNLFNNMINEPVWEVVFNSVFREKGPWLIKEYSCMYKKFFSGLVKCARLIINEWKYFRG